MKRFLLAASALIALPALAAAQPYGNYDRGDHRGQQQSAPQRSQPAPQRAAPAYRQAPRQAYTPPARQNFGQAYHYQAPAQRQYAPAQRSYQGRAYAEPQNRYQGGQYQNRQYQARQYQGRQYQGGQAQPYNRGYAQGYRGQEWNRGQWNGGDRGQWREGWWRGHRGFEGYEGPRVGFWFAPGWGYYSVDPYWANYDWVVGSFVPDQFRSYYISDPWDYGLPPAPWGARWIFLGDRIVLIDLRTGYILQFAGGY
ncbi:MAG TPA: RcnB family protein [Caulobacteraceae bacterium]|nr:RcnB family protein [Caulobacteraceae bacterium]